MHIEFLLEESSSEIVLQEIVPKIISDRATFRFHNFRGKQDLLKKLPDRLKGYRTLLQSNKDWRIVILIDKDAQDCDVLKKELEQIASQIGLTTPTTAPKFQVLNRIAVEELEAWYFGDVRAIRRAYPRVSERLDQKRSYRKPDDIRGGTWEALERILSSKGYYKKGFMPKTEVARNIAPHLDPDLNSSKSFHVFIDGLRRLLET